MSTPFWEASFEPPLFVVISPEGKITMLTTEPDEAIDQSWALGPNATAARLTELVVTVVRDNKPSSDPIDGVLTSLAIQWHDTGYASHIKDPTTLVPSLRGWYNDLTAAWGDYPSRKISAIKEVRTQTGWGLGHAKGFVDEVWRILDSNGGKLVP